MRGFTFHRCFVRRSFHLNLTPETIFASEIPYHIRLTGLSLPDGEISFRTLSLLCSALSELSERVVRLKVEGTSVRPGSAPQWIREVTDFRAASLLPGSTVLALLAPSLAGRSDSPDQAAFVDDEGVKTALSIVADAVDEVATGKIDGEHLDRGVLESLGRFSSITSMGVDLTISAVADPSHSYTINRRIIERAAEWKQKTPVDRSILVTGTLESIRHASAAFSLVGADDSRIRGYLQHRELIEQLRDLWGTAVTVEGRASYSSSGKMRQIEAVSIRPYQTGDELVMAHVGHGDDLFVSRQAELTGSELHSLRGTLSSDEPIDDLLKDL